MWTKLKIPGSLLLVAAALAACQDQPLTAPVPNGAALGRVLQPGQFEPPCGDVMTVVLRDAAGGQVGQVEVWNGQTTAYARLTAQHGWEFTEVRVGGARQPEQFPRMGGVVDPTRFRFGGAVSPPQRELVIEALYLGNPYGVQPGDEVLLAIFARLQPVGGGGSVSAWGEGTPFQQGQHPMYFQYALPECPPAEPPPPFDPSTITAGSRHSCALTRSGVAYCWGQNFSGELGDGTRTDRLTPVAVTGGIAFSVLSAGNGVTCGLTLESEAYCWGANQAGELGLGFLGGFRTTPSLVEGGLRFTDISVGVRFTCAIASDNQPYCWGSNSNGQLGDGTTETRLIPTAVVGDLSIGYISAGWRYACGVTTRNEAYCWGANDQGQLGDGTTTDRLTPAAVAGELAFAQISLAASVPGWHTCGVTTDGVGYCWGFNGNGRLGDGTTIQRLVPTAVAGGLVFTHVSAGGTHSCGVTRDDVTYCWGFNGWGQLGDGTTLQRLVPTTVAGELAFRAISAGDNHTCGLTTDGGAYCWGQNQWGQLGDGTSMDRLTPTPVAGWRDLATAPFGLDLHYAFASSWARSGRAVTTAG